MVVKVVEIIGESHKSWEDAAQNAVKVAAKTVRNICGIEAIRWTADVKGKKSQDSRQPSKLPLLLSTARNHLRVFDIPIIAIAAPRGGS